MESVEPVPVRKDCLSQLRYLAGAGPAIVLPGWGILSGVGRSACNMGEMGSVGNVCPWVSK